MLKKTAGLAVLTLATGLGAALAAPTVSAAPAVAPEPPVTRADAAGVAGAAPAGAPGPPALSDDLGNPLEDKRRALREQALTMLLHGRGQVQQRGPSTVMKVGSAPAVEATAPRTLRQSGSGDDQFVELARETTDRIFVVLVEFGNRRHPAFPDQDTDPQTPGPAVFDGPLHNAIPEPDREVDNATVWQPDFSRAHFQDLYFGTGAEPGAGEEFESLRTYYERQSSGRYSVDGLVTDWVRVRFNEARYGRSGGFPCADIVCSNTWNLVQDAMNQWVADQRAAGLTRAQVRAQLATFDVWDRYDHDGDGDFNETDGYIDHFQVVHAGGDEANGDPQQGEDAIWSHRWYVQLTPIGAGGPQGAPLGGTPIADTGFWVGDYTIQPENGGVSVFAHEFAHDLGLPDLYDTSGGGENSVNWWSIMAQDRLSAEDDLGIGTRAGDFGAWEKLQLGWLDFRAFRPARARTLRLGPHEFNTARPQAVVVVLPRKQKTTRLFPPATGARSWWSGMGDDLDNTLTRRVRLPARAATLRMQARWDIEDCGPDPCDYAFVEVDDGSGWAAIPGSITRAREGHGIDGTSQGWQRAAFDLSRYRGRTVGLRLHYRTDGAVGGKGFFADDVTVAAGGRRVFASGAERGVEGWTRDGFSAAGTSVTTVHDNFYIASHRGYVSFDRYLQTGPYHFGFATAQPDLVDHFPYQDGLLLSYWDTSQPDNNTSEHPGRGLILPVDANPRPLVRDDGELWRTRVAGYDAPFSLERSDALLLHEEGAENRIAGRAAQPVFDDGRRFWFPQAPSAGVRVPDAGVRIEVLGVDGTSMTVRVARRR